MSHIAKINRGLDFIESNLFDEFELSAVADAAGMSQWHFQRIFSALTGETLKSYIRARRLSSAMKSLLKTEKRIIEIAVDAGYESQESFTRAFQSQFGKTPGEFRKEQAAHLFMEKIRIDQDYLRHISKGLTREPEIVSFPERHFVGMRTVLYGVESEKNNMADQLKMLWSKFVPHMFSVPDRVADVGYGLIRQLNDPEGQLEYFSTMEVKAAPTALPTGMVGITIPEQKYARFVHKGFVKDINHSVNYIYSSWLLNSDYFHSSGFDIEEYGSKYHATSIGSEIDYMIPVVSSKDTR